MSINRVNPCADVDLLSYKRRTLMVYGQHSSDTFLIIVAHLKDKQSGCPFDIPGQRKCSADGVNNFTVKSRNVTRIDNPSIFLSIANFKYILHLQLHCLAKKASGRAAQHPARKTLL